MTTYTIGEVAERSGFSASALRYYEGIGLVEPFARTDAGYRVYDDHTIARLAFIDRAKQLGCWLEEITDLVGIWDGERCGPVQRRFHELVTSKIANSQRRLGELAAFTGQLQAAAAQLAGPAVDGPCDDGCACLGERAAAMTRVPDPVALTTSAGPPIACTLEPGAMPDRLADWQAVLDHVEGRSTTADGRLRLELDDGTDVAGLAELAAAEQHCCAFFSFAITVDDRGVGLEVTAPEGADGIVAALFGVAA